MVKTDKVDYFFKKAVFFGKNRTGRMIALFLDFDGTLVPIQKTPAHCILSEKTKKQLELLAGSDRCYLTIISGRGLSDIKKKVGIHKIYYVGNHGLDVSGPGLRYTHPTAVISKWAIERVARRLRKEIACTEGAWLENKKFGVSLHFRSVETKNITFVKKIFRAVSNEFVVNKSLYVTKGKKVLELSPDVSWNKGSATLWLLQRLKDRCLPIYIGDDQTDKTAFRALDKKGITVRVGRSKKTAAEYYLKGH
jgi:trehalose 6-phosphate phosphatase